MKFTVEKYTLLKSLSHVQSIVEKKNTLPILSNILLEAKENSLILSATDMDISRGLNHSIGTYYLRYYSKVTRCK